MLITVFTPTYNRASLLPRLFDSLLAQSFQEFEWVIVDDGSKDNTRDVVNGFIESRKLSVRYYYQQNGGKHRAINEGVRRANGELFFIADSDDVLPPDALENVWKYYAEVKGNNDFAGVCGLDADFRGDIIGNGLPQDRMEVSSIDIRHRYHVKGDMREVFRTDVMKEFPFPEMPNERFCPEQLVWFRIASNYKLLYFNDPIYWVEYQPDGISAAMAKILMNNPIASTITFSEELSYNIPFKAKLKAAVNYWRFYIVRKKDRKIEIPFYWLVVYPLGIAMHLRDLILIKRS